MADYATAAGFVQFPVTEREANGSQVRDVTIKTLGTEGVLVRITLWPDFDDVDVEQGDFVAVDGKIEIREVGENTYTNLNANKLAVISGTSSTPKEREVVGKKSSTKRF